MANELRSGQIVTEVEHSPTSDKPSGVHAGQVYVEVEHTGGGGYPLGVHCGQFFTEVEHGPTGDKPDGIHVAALVIEVEYVETYPNVPLTGYTPRLLVDILFPTSGIARFTTEDTYVEEI